MFANRIRIALELLLSLSLALTAVVLFWQTQVHSDRLDFVIYHGAGAQLLNGLTPYAFYGPYRLPFQYFPWASLLFAPFAMLPFDAAWVVYSWLMLPVLGLGLAVVLSAFGVRLTPRHGLAVFALTVLAAWLLVRVGQVSHMQFLAVAVVLYCLKSDRPFAAGLWLPLLLFKPQTVMLFLVVATWHGGRRFLLGGLVSIGLALAVSTWLIPTWPADWQAVMLELAARPPDQLAWGFFTLPGLLGLPRSLHALSLLLVPPSLYLLYRYRHLPLPASLSLALSMSLVCAPYAFAYDATLLVPALVWAGAGATRATLALFAAYAITLWLAAFSSGAYLAVLVVALFGLRDAQERLRQTHRTTNDYLVSVPTEQRARVQR